MAGNGPDVRFQELIIKGDDATFVSSVENTNNRLDFNKRFQLQNIKSYSKNNRKMLHYYEHPLKIQITA